MGRKNTVILKTLILIFLLIPSCLFAGTFEWDQVTGAVGYRIYCEGTLLYTIAHPADHLSVSDTPQGYYTITAYDQTNESEHSNPILIAGYYYNAVRYEYDNSFEKKLLYKGEHTQQDASVDDPNWIITKYYYNGDVVDYTRTRTTSWTSRALGW